MLPLSPRISQCTGQFFIKRLKFLAATSSLRVEQNLVHLDRFLHLSQKVVGVTLTPKFLLGVLCTAHNCTVYQSSCHGPQRTEAIQAGETSSFNFTVCVKSVPLYHF